MMKMLKMLKMLLLFGLCCSGLTLYYIYTHTFIYLYIIYLYICQCLDVLLFLMSAGLIKHQLVEY